MEELNLPATTNPAGELPVYRPVSGLAIAGLVLAGLFAGLVVLSAGVALAQGAPMFFPDWIVILPLGGAGLSFLAQKNIRDSEGTRAGLGLTRWGIGLSVFAGLGYFAYQYFTGLALTQQANEFLMVQEADAGFFPHVRAGTPAEINAAFLLTLPESSRGNIDPKNLRKMALVHDRAGGREKIGPLSQFRDHFLIRAMARPDKDITVEPRGVQAWVYEKNGYKVVRNYRITTPEMIFDILVPVQSTEGEQRKWFVAFPQTQIRNATLTPLGIALKNSANQARFFIEQNIGNLETGQAFPKIPDVTQWEKVVVGIPWRPLRDHIKRLFRGGEKEAQQMSLAPIKDTEREISPWLVVENRLRFIFKFSYRFKGPQGKPWSGDGLIIVEDQKPMSLNAKKMPEPDGLSAQPEWKFISLEFTRFGEIADMAPPGMGPPH